MTAMALRAVNRPVMDGDLDARVVDGMLELPQSLATALRAQDVQTAEELVSYGLAFPSSLAAMLGWSPEAAHAAVAHLARQLEMTDAGTARPEIAFGARCPGDRRTRE